jgi:diguanylate cyclase (GGDEF)-like protein/PAS domain S-box-containing protein
MGTLSPRSIVDLAAGLSVLAVGILRFAGWLQSDRAVEMALLVLAAVLSSGLRPQPSTPRDWATMPPFFVVVFSALLLFDPHVSTLVAAVAIAVGFATSEREFPRTQVLMHALQVLIATQVAGQAYTALSGLPAALVWPWRAAPVAVAVVAYHLTQGALAELLVPVILRRPINRSFATNALAGCHVYFVGGSIALGLVEAVTHRLWEALPVGAAALFFGYRMYADYTVRLEEQQRRREVIDLLQQGMAVVDADGRVTVWNDALERILACPRDRAIGRPLHAALPAVSRTELARTIQDVLKDGQPRTVAQFRLPSGTAGRILQVRVQPVIGGAALLWSDITERTQAEQELKRAEERLALAAEGANDGLWQWDLRTREFYVSGRWRAMIGLPARAGIGRIEEWLERVHPDDLAGLNETLKAYLAGHTDVFLHEHRISHQDGNYRRFLCRGVAVHAAGRRRDRIAGSLTDTTEQAITQERLRSVGVLDALTGLYNRAIFVEGLGRRLDDFKLRRVSNCFAVLYLDLDRFKIINDSLGHLVGDELLIAVSRRLEACLRQGDALARLGGDEFAILLNGIADDGQANAIAFRIQESLSAPFSIGGREVFTSASIGIAFGPAHYKDPDEVMRDADTAMYHAKSRGKARHEVFDADMHARVRDRLSLENDLRRAITSNDFEVNYQPIVSLTSGMCIGFESLVRWTRNGEAISPATFIPIAEELGLIEPLGTWVLQQACQTFAEWQRRFPGAGLDCITVNVSSRQLMQQNFLRVVQQAVQKSGLKPADLRVEITETALMDSPGEAAGVLRDLRDFGVKVYLDDFGTGYSSLSHLHKLPVDALKIDRSFVKSLLLPNRPAIVESILALARTLNTSVVAEGIETDVQARELERLGCTHAQGFLFSRPLSTRSAEELVRANRPLGPKGPVASQVPLHGSTGQVVAATAAASRPGGARVATPAAAALRPPLARA